MPDFPVTETFVKAANPLQLHDETRGTLVKWPASFTYVNGTWVYRVERDDIDAAKVRAALDAHKPDPNYGLAADVLTLRELRAKTNLTASDVGTAVRLLLKGVRP